jgi:hypothetical protein
LTKIETNKYKTSKKNERAGERAKKRTNIKQRNKNEPTNQRLNERTNKRKKIQSGGIQVDRKQKVNRLVWGEILLEISNKKQ